MSDSTWGLHLLALILGFAVSLLSGWLGIGGGIVMAPALLYLPPLVGLPALDMKTVSGLTITQGLFACLSGGLRHDRYHFVDHTLVLWMGSSIFASALAGALFSRWLANDTLLLVFAGLATVAAVLMWVPRKDPRDEIQPLKEVTLNVPLAVAISIVVGGLGGMVGQGGSFILIPLLLHFLKLPTRIVIGSNLALVFFSSLAGFLGKLASGQVPLLPAVVLVLGAVPGAQLGGILSRHTQARWLRIVLAAVILVCAARIVFDVVS